MSFPEPHAIPLAGAGADELNLLGSNTAERNETDGTSSLGEPRPTFRVGGVDRKHGGATGLAGHGVTAWATAEAKG
jgi:hypothetical protein